MLERKLIAAALQDRGAYEAIAASELAAGFDELVRPLWDGIARFYERDEGAKSCDVELVGQDIARRFPNPKRGEDAARLLNSLGEETVSVPAVAEYIRDELVRRAGDRLAASIAGRRPDEEISGALQKYVEAREAPAAEKEESPEEAWQGVLATRIDQGQRFPVSPRVLNQYIGGGLAPGHNVTIFARPEAGKTALAITMACGFARRGLKVLYIGNEDPIQDLMVRMITNLSGRSVDELAADPEEGERIALEKGARNIVVKATAPGTMAEIEALVKRHKPNVLVVDQLRNINGGKSDNFTQLLDKNAQMVRALGKRYDLVTVSVTQAGDSASGKPILDMGDVDSSNTGIPGAADLMIGVGVTDSLEAAGQRMLSLPKNKLGVVKPHVVVEIDPYRSKMR